MNIPKYATIGEIPTSYVAPIIQVGDEVYSWSGSQYAPPGVSAAPGSPSAPFASEAQRTAWATANLATLLPGRSTVWGPGNVEYRFVGPGATGWVEIPLLVGFYADFASLPATGRDGSIATIPGTSFVWGA